MKKVPTILLIEEKKSWKKCLVTKFLYNVDRCIIKEVNVFKPTLLFEVYNKTIKATRQVVQFENVGLFLCCCIALSVSALGFKLVKLKCFDGTFSIQFSPLFCTVTPFIW